MYKPIRIAHPRASFVGVLDKRKRLVSIYVIRVDTLLIAFVVNRTIWLIVIACVVAHYHARERGRALSKRVRGAQKGRRAFHGIRMIHLDFSSPPSRSYNHLTCSNARRTRWRLPFIIERHRYYYGGGNAAQFLCRKLKIEYERFAFAFAGRGCRFFAV